MRNSLCKHCVSVLNLPTGVILFVCVTDAHIVSLFEYFLAFYSAVRKNTCTALSVTVNLVLQNITPNAMNIIPNSYVSGLSVSFQYDVTHFHIIKNRN